MRLQKASEQKKNTQLMEEGVSLSLPRKGVPGDNHLSSMISDSFTWERVFYVGSVPFSGEHIYAGESILAYFRSANDDGSSVLCTKEQVPFMGFAPYSREQVFSGKSYLLGLLVTFGDCVCFPEESNESFRVDPPETATGLGSNMGGDRPIFSSPGHGFAGQTSQPFLTGLGGTAA